VVTCSSGNQVGAIAESGPGHRRQRRAYRRKIKRASQARNAIMKTQHEREEAGRKSQGS